MFRGKVRRIHFVGIGGTGMSGIAEVLCTMGYAVSGSDMKEGAAVVRLRSLGATIHVPHAAEHVAGADVVVRSTAIPDGNVEIRAAQAVKVPVIPRAEMLGELMRMKYGIAVAGTHGKTTTTSMLARVLFEAGRDPTIVIGGRLDHLGSSARLGAGEFMVAEADESDGSFLLLDPTVTVITNIDPEHMEHWGTLERLVDGFADFAGRVPFFGFTALCLDHPVVQALIPRLRRPVVTYGLSAQADVRATDLQTEGVRTTFVAWNRDSELGPITIGIPGVHNVLNSLAATAVALELGLSFEEIQRALFDFKGVDRRFSIRAEAPLAEGGDPVTIVDDYGHHPTEIRATLEAAASAWPRRRIIAVFQPHRYSRVHDLAEDFARSFNAASHVLVCPIYRAGETPIEGVDHRLLATSIVGHGHRSVSVVDGLDEAAEELARITRPGDVVITLGAGDVNQVCGALAQQLWPEGVDG